MNSGSWNSNMVFTNSINPVPPNQSKEVAMKAMFVSLLGRTVLSVIALSGTSMCTGALADGPVVGWVESPDFSAFRIKRGEAVLPQGQSDLQACDVVQLQNDVATVRITLFGYQRVQLNAKVPGREIKVPCEEKPSWYGKPLAVVRAIAGLATAPSNATSRTDFARLAGSRSPDESPRLSVPALGNYNPLLVAGERSLYLTWEGGVAPYTVTLQRYGGGNVVEQTNIGATSVRFPRVRLEPGRYVLLVQGSDKYGIKEDTITVVEASRLPPPPKALTDANLPKADHELLYAYYLEGWGQGEWTLEALQRAATIHPATPAVHDWLVRRFGG